MTTVTRIVDMTGAQRRWKKSRRVFPITQALRKTSDLREGIFDDYSDEELDELIEMGTSTSFRQ